MSASNPVASMNSASGLNLLTDEASRQAVAQDFGGHVQRMPAAVVRPRSIQDVVEAVRHARQHGLKLAARGQGHTNHGQAQVERGLVVDMSDLSTIHSVQPGVAVVDGGVLWGTLADQALAGGQCPPVLTDFLGLTVGGTLSMAGFGTQTFRQGNQTDNVLELTVVTGTGEVVTCSPEREPALFNACLGGLGQFGIIVGARLKLVAVPPLARHYVVPYANIETLVTDLTRAAADKRFHQLFGVGTLEADGRWMLAMDAVYQYAPGQEPNNEALLAGLSGVPGATQVQDMPLSAYVHRYEPLFAQWKGAGLWDAPHPWLDIMVPASVLPSFGAQVLRDVKPREFGVGGAGLILMYPASRSLCRTPLVSAPQKDEQFFLFDLLRNMPGATHEQVAAAIEDNRRIYERARELGGSLYPISAVRMDAADWQRHFGANWNAMVEAKRRFDPDHLLAPSYGMFR